MYIFKLNKSLLNTKINNLNFFTINFYILFNHHHSNICPLEIYYNNSFEE